MAGNSPRKRRSSNSGRHRQVFEQAAAEEAAAPHRVTPRVPEGSSIPPFKPQTKIEMPKLDLSGAHAVGQRVVDNVASAKIRSGPRWGRAAAIGIPTAAVGGAGFYALRRRRQAQRARATQEAVGKRYFGDVDDVFGGFLDYTSDYARSAPVVRW